MIRVLENQLTLLQCLLAALIRWLIRLVALTPESRITNWVLLMLSLTPSTSLGTKFINIALLEEEEVEIRCFQSWWPSQMRSTCMLILLATSVLIVNSVRLEKIWFFPLPHLILWSLTEFCWNLFSSVNLINPNIVCKSS